jgi:hypothetical protein
MTGDDDVEGRDLAQAGDAALHQCQPPGLHVSQISLPGLRQHYRREVNAPDPGAAEPPKRLLTADARPGSQLGDLLQVTLAVLADLLHDPPAELGVAPGHTLPDHPAEEAMRMSELPGDDRHQAPPMTRDHCQAAAQACAAADSPFREQYEVPPRAHAVVQAFREANLRPVLCRHRHAISDMASQATTGEPGPTTASRSVSTATEIRVGGQVIS